MRRLLITMVLVGLALPGVASAASTAPTPPPQLQHLVGALGGDPAQAGAARYRDLGKLDGRIQQLAADRLNGQASSATTTSGLSVAGPRVLVDVYVDGSVAGAATTLRAQGMDVTATSTAAPQRMVEGWVPATTTPDVAALDTTTALVPVVRPRISAWPGAADSQGDAAHQGPAARALGATGSGITVGVMSDSMNQVGSGVAGSQASGDLPANVQVLQDDPSPGGTDEGRAMAEIVYDEAPGISKLLFATAFSGAAGKASNIAALVSNGARLIADDTAYYGQPWFQDGAITQAVDQARANGTTYLVSAGNEGRQSWEGTFAPTGSSFNDFGGGATTHAFASLPAGTAGRTIEVQWAEPWGSAADRFQVTLSAPGATSITGTNATGIPDVVLDTPADATARLWSISIKRISGTGTPFMKYIVSGGSSNLTGSAADTAPTIAGDAAAAAGAITVAAVQSTNGASSVLTSPESFSSRGPVTIRFNTSGTPITPVVRNKPEVAGADGVATTVPGGLGQGCTTSAVSNCFFGTSAAAPSIEGIGALVLSARPSLTADQLAAILTNPANAIDCTSAVGQPDTDCGAGFLQADRAVAQAQSISTTDSTPPVVTATVSPSQPNGANGWYTGSPSVSWSVVDTESAISSRTGCTTTSYTTDGTFTAPCVATSSGGTTTQSVTIRRDASPPAAPVVSGLSSTTYASGSAPAQSAVSCTASDPTSGVTSCTVGAVDGSAGTHTVVATATNGAGLTSTASVTYTVAAAAAAAVVQTPTPLTPSITASTPAVTKATTTPVLTTPAALSTVTIASIKRATLLKKGLTATLSGTRPNLRVVASLVATYTTGSGRTKKTRRVTVATRSTTLMSSGTQTLKLTLSSKGRATLKHRGTTLLTLTVSATAPGARAVSVTKTATMKP